MSGGMEQMDTPATGERPIIAATRTVKRRGPRLSRADRTPLGLWFWEIDRVLLLLVSMLVAIGLVAVAAASPVAAQKLSTTTATLDPLYYFYRQLMWVIVGVPVMLAVSMLPKAQAREVAVEKLRRVGLKPEVADLYPAELSGGMQKRVGLARAIAAEPEIIFFDEPTTGLDPIMAGVINDLIREIVVEMGATAMTITHDMSSVRAIADTVAMLHGGVIRWTGPVGEMDATPDPYVQQFIHGRAEGPIASVR